MDDPVVRPLARTGVLLALVACSGQQSGGWAPAEDAALRSGAAMSPRVQLDDHAIAASAVLPATASRPTSKAAQATERRLIYSGALRIAVGDPEATMRRASEIAAELGGYVQSLNDDALTLRLPVDRWEEGLEAVSSLGRVVGRSLEVQDVTEEFVDVELRLKNLRELSARLSELLARAETVEAALKVETELARVRGEIERLEGRLKLLRDRIAFATLRLSLVRVAEQAGGRRLPFEWLQQLGVERLLGLQGGSR